MTKVILMSGIPGSGKTTYVKKLGEVVVCSADHFFECGGGYEFDPSKLDEAHALCFAKFTRALLASEEVIVVDNTNTTFRELAPYIVLAKAFMASCEIVTVKCDPKIAYSRNIHGVSLSTIQRMADNIASRKIPPSFELESIKLTVI